MSVMSRYVPGTGKRKKRVDRGDGDRRAHPRVGPLEVHLTLRHVPILDELVHVVRGRIEGLADATRIRGRCDVLVRGYWWRGERRFAADLQVTDGVHEIRVCESRRDLFAAIDSAFGALHRRLAVEVQTGDWEVDDSDELPEEMGFAPVRPRTRRHAIPWR